MLASARKDHSILLVWTVVDNGLVIFYCFVLSMRTQVILDCLFARPGSAHIWGGKKGEFRDWTRFCPEAKIRGGIIVSPAYTYKECVKYWCSMRINPDLIKLSAHGCLG